MAKRIVLLTMGTRGDVQPASVIAGALARAGYDVCLGVPENFLHEPDCHSLYLDGAGVEVVRCGPDMRALLDDPQIKEIITGGIVTKIRQSRSAMKKWIDQSLADSVKAADRADAILFHPKLNFAVDIAEAVDAVPILFAFQPLTPTGEFPLFVFPWENLGRTLNWRSYDVLRLSRLILGGKYNRARKELLGLPPVTRFKGPYCYRGKRVRVLYSISPSLLAKPADWPENCHLTGYWSPPARPDRSLPENLSAFIEHGPPPLYIGFGSMPIENPEKSATLIGRAVAKAGVRAVIAQGWGRLAPVDMQNNNTVTFLDEAVPHEILFPSVGAVVHHGGAGTTTTGLRAGKPTLVCPFLVDQPFWGRRIFKLGAGPKPLPPKKWSEDILANAFQDVMTNEDYRRKAQDISDQMAQEDGVGRTVEIIKSVVGD